MKVFADIEIRDPGRALLDQVIQFPCHYQIQNDGTCPESATKI